MSSNTVERYLEIIPNDTLFFGSGRPFSAGDDTWTDVIFPPYPSTFYGALNTYIVASNQGFSAFTSGNSDTKVVEEIVGPFIKKHNTVLLPVPLDLFIEEGMCFPKDGNRDGNKGRKVEKITTLSMLQNNLFVSDGFVDINKVFLLYRESCEVCNREEVYLPLDLNNLTDYYLSLEGFVEYLKNGSVVRDMLTRRSEVVTGESKVGIKLDSRTRTSEESYLYRVSMLRLMSGVSFLVNVKLKENESIEEGVLHLGGEGKTAQVRFINEDLLKKLREIDISGTEGSSDLVFKVVLLTPAIFDKGWLPDGVDESTLEGSICGLRVKLIYCVIGKYQRVGGWDMEKGRPKPMKKAVPAGSVYYFKLLDKNVNFENILEKIHLKSLCKDELGKQGFGLCAVGVSV